MLLVEKMCWPLPEVSFVYLGTEMNQPGEIISKVWLLIKQGVQELWYYSNNDVIVFPYLLIQEVSQAATWNIKSNDISYSWYKSSWRP